MTALEPDPRAQIATRYRRFAQFGAAGRSPLYEGITKAVAEDAQIVEWLAEMPEPKQQPNLLLGAVRFLYGTPEEPRAFISLVHDRWDEVAAVMSVRSTQTNEPGRCAALLPVLTRLPQPLALLEVGASAGLCLLPDRYGYDYGERRLMSARRDVEPPIFPCAVNAATPIPEALPSIAWRAGLDLEPVDIADRNQVAWLETLVWPEQTDRLTRLRAALDIASTDKPRLVEGDLRRDLTRLANEMPRDATRVIFHTAVLTYVGPTERAEFARSVTSFCDVWIANEAPQVFPEIAARAGTPGPRGHFLLAANGQPLAWADPHGASLDWIA